MTRRNTEGKRPAQGQPATRLAAPDPAAWAQLATLRRALYRFLAVIYLPPDEDRYRQLLEAARTIRADRALLAHFHWYLHWQPLLDHLTNEHPPNVAELLRAYTSLFVIGPGGRPSCSLYASSYLDPDRRLAGFISLQVEQQYRTAGFVLAPQMHELPDHLAIELEFVAALCAYEAEAWQARAAAHLRAILQQERHFLDTFVGSWLPELARRLVHDDMTGVYSAAAEAATALVRHDLDLLAILLSQVDEV